MLYLLEYNPTTGHLHDARLKPHGKDYILQYSPFFNNYLPVLFHKNGDEDILITRLIEQFRLNEIIDGYLTILKFFSKCFDGRRFFFSVPPKDYSDLRIISGSAIRKLFPNEETISE